VEINSGVHLLKSEIRQVPLFTSGGIGLKNLVLFASLQYVTILELGKWGPWGKVIVGGSNREATVCETPVGTW